MKRRQILSKIAIGGASYTMLTACGGATEYGVDQSTSTGGEQPLLEWRCATSWSKDLTATVYGGVEALCQRVSQLTNGRFNIIPSPEGEIVPGLEVFSAVSQNKVECGHTSPSYYVKQNSAFSFATTLPFGLNAKQQMAWLSAGGGLELIRKLYEKFNVINFPAANSTNQMGGWYRKKVNSLADLKGLKVRLVGIGGDILERLGAEIVTMPGSQIVPAMKSGELDAAEFTGPYDDEQFGFHKVATYYYYPGWHQPGPSYDFIVNLEAWNKLPASYQQAITVASTEAYGDIIARYNVENIKALQRLKEGGTQLEAFSQDILTQAQKIAFEIYEQNAAENPDFKQIYEQWKLAREKTFKWDKIVQLSYNNFVFNS